MHDDHDLLRSAGGVGGRTRGASIEGYHWVAVLTLDHARLQYGRLQRHDQIVRHRWDAVAFLDLSHVLRVWSDMKLEAQRLIEEQRLALRFTHFDKTKDFKALVRGTTYTYLPFASGVAGPIGSFRNVWFTDRVLNDEEMAAQSSVAYSTVQPREMTLSDWFGAEIIVRELDNRFDPHIRALHGLIVGEIPATFHEAIEISHDLLTILHPAFGW